MIFKNSRYEKGILLYFDKSLELSYLDFPSTFFEVDEKDFVYQIKAGESIETLANHFYGNGKLKWILLYANPHYNSELEIKAGDIISVPRAERVLDYVNGIR